MSQRVDRKLATIEDLIIEVKQRIQKLERELYTIATTIKEFSVASQQIASKEAERRHLQNQLRSLKGSSSSVQPPNPNLITSPVASSPSLYRPSESPFVASKHTMQPIYVAPPTESYISNLPSYMQPLSPPEYRHQKAEQPILLNQHLYDMFPKQYHHVLNQGMLNLNLNPPNPSQNPEPRLTHQILLLEHRPNQICLWLTQ